jgi:hypothetical protein
MKNLLKKIIDKLRMPYDPNPTRRAEVVQLLSKRSTLSDEEWHQQDITTKEIPLSFVSWFRATCSTYFGYDLSAALPTDRLVEDLGMYEATFSDIEMDIIEDFEAKYGTKYTAPMQSEITTFGQLAEMLWSQAKVIDNAEPRRRL